MSGRTASWTVGNPQSTLRQLLAGQAVALSITTISPAGNLMQIEHGLGRIPLGYTLSDPPFAVIQYGRNAGDTAHTDRYLYVRFSVASTDLKLLVF